MTNFPEIYLIALQSAAQASQKILQVYAEEFEPSLKADGSPVTKADLASSKIIHEHLSSTNIPITGEESLHEAFEVRQNWEYSWCVDPLDGTKEFVKRNDEFCINIALIKNTRPIFGLIASPVQNKVLFGGEEIGVYLSNLSKVTDTSHWTALHPGTAINSPIVVASSRSHHSGSDLHYINGLKQRVEQVAFSKMGSALKFFNLAQGIADVYPRFAPTMEWDIAAGQAILEALGGEVVHAETSQPLCYNKSNLRNPYFIAKTKAFLVWENQ